MNLIDRVIKNEIKNLERVKDTFDERFDYLRLDKNERIIPFPEDLLNQFRSSIISADISGYYELGSLYSKLAKYLGVKSNQLLMATGSDLAIKSVYEACVGCKDNIVIHLPSYAMCRVYARMFGAQVRGVPVKRDWSIDIEAMLSQVDDKTKMMVLENPNGFVGTKPELSQIEDCAVKLKERNVILLVDEAYYYIENEQSQTVALTTRYPNLIVSQTFSKCHGIAGTRFGYLVGNSELMQYVSRVRPMHEITSLTALAANWVLDHPEILRDYRNQVKESKQYLREELAELKISFKDAHGNFILAFFPEEGKTKGLADKLKKNKILVRRPFEEVHLKGWMRITVGARSDSERLINAVKDAVK